LLQFGLAVYQKKIKVTKYRKIKRKEGTYSKSNGPWEMEIQIYINILILHVGCYGFVKEPKKKGNFN
jgi:hypothetical protein